MTVMLSLAGGFFVSALIFSGLGNAFGEQILSVKKAGEVVVAQVTEAVQNLTKSERVSRADYDGMFVATTTDKKSSSSKGLGSIQGWQYDIKAADKAVLANLETMKLSMYEKGILVEEIDIVSKGRPGTPWETPSGKYEVLYKKENHFSSIGHVYMPSSIQFFGNFFIHGWPYYPDGTPVPEGYSGGCIRLTQEDALKVFNFTEKGTPIIVLGSEYSPDDTGGSYIVDSSRKADIRAESFLVADLETGEVILEKARSQVRPIASITKLMTALVYLEVVSQYQTATISQRAVDTEGFRGNFTPGEKISTGDLVYPLLLESSNDAAEVMAEHYGRKIFIEQMNNKASSIGLDSTFFYDPSGLSKLNVSSAEDLFRLLQHIYLNKRHVLDVTLLEEYRTEAHMWTNNSRFLKDEGLIGGKNGFTDEAGKTQVVLYSMPLAEFEDRKVAIVLLSTPDVAKDVNEIKNYLMRHVSYKK